MAEVQRLREGRRRPSSSSRLRDRFVICFEDDDLTPYFASAGLLGGGGDKRSGDVLLST